jgi:methanogenic corrinoid protein MtbC1
MAEAVRDPHRELLSRRESLARTIVDIQYGREPEIWNRYGEEGYRKSLRDEGYHLSFLAEAIRAQDPTLFSHYIAWVRSLFNGLGLPEGVISTTLGCTREVIRETLTEETGKIASSYIDAALQHLEEVPEEPDSFLGEGGTLTDLARCFLKLLLNAQLHEARTLIFGAVEEGISVEDIYLEVFQRSQREIGRLWQLNRITVAQEHYCTAATQLIMSQLYPYIFSTEKTGKRMVAACVGGELHELGVRMVADIFEMVGWDTYYLGANVPPHSIAQSLSRYGAQLLALSTTMTFHIESLIEVIGCVRAEYSHSVKILVGGYPFNISSELWKSVGADGYARDAREALTVADRLVR